MICNRNYNKKKAVFVFTRGDLACKTHAIVPVAVGDHVVQVERNRKTCNVCDFEVKAINENKVTLRVVHKGVLNTDYRGNKAVEAAIEKSNTYHCREAIYIRA